MVCCYHFMCEIYAYMKQKRFKYAIFNTVSTCEISYIPIVDNFTRIKQWISVSRYKDLVCSQTDSIVSLSKLKSVRA